MPEEAIRLEPNDLLMQVTNAVVQIMSDFLGRGPTRARAHLTDNVLVIVTQDNLTKAERRLLEDGEEATVRGLRRKFQSTMRDDLVGAIEQLTGRHVVSFLSDHDAVTDHGVEVFVLDGTLRPANG